MTIIFGNNGNDTLFGGAGDDTIAGFGGFDTVVFSGSSQDYRFGTLNNYLIVTDTNLADGNDGSDRLSGIESLQFSDRSIGVSVRGETRVNTTTASDQINASVSALTDGGYVVVWQSEGQDGDYSGVYAQRFDAGGAASGGEFRVNTTTRAAQQNAAVSDLADGGFVVTWESWDADTANWNILAQRFDAAGTAQGNEIVVNATTASDQILGAVTDLSGGGFVIAWQSWSQDGSGYGIYAQRFDAAGTAAGNEFMVATTAADWQSDAAISGLPDGSFVVTWVSWNQDGDGAGIYARHFDASGIARTAEIKVNTTTIEWQLNPTLCALADGGFIILWQSYNQDGSAYGVYGQRFSAAAAAQGSEFRINTTTAGDQSKVSTAALADGGFVVAWMMADADGAGITAQRFDADSVAVGQEFLVNTTTAASQQTPSVAALADGGFVISWDTWGQDGSGTAIYSQRYGADGTLAPAVLRGTAADDSFNLTDQGSVAASGFAGDDTYTVNAVANQIYENAGQGTDLVQAGITWSLGANTENLTLTGIDAIDGFGNGDANLIRGNINSNRLYGADGDDNLRGGRGDDVLAGGAGSDRLSGGKGRDVFVFDAPLSESSNVDWIRDFTSGADMIYLDVDVFSALSGAPGGALSAGQFHQQPGATTAHDADDRIIFDTASGALYYDADGAGGHAAIQFARVDCDSHASLSAGDFLVVG